ncbi:tuberin isoform X2 [Pararge aegeria]|uniref:tuberin isoform X2 n=1 Tax=Pararge aegeria TaxID=116150 RepID=UPI0019D2B941|nr:tuberin isoform X2 [Pararge aegeria]
MGSRDRDTKSLHDKLKVFFKKGATAPLAAANELVVGAELARDLGPESPLHRRLRAIKEVGEKVLHIRVQDGGVEKIWSCIRDLLEDPNSEGRHAALGLLRCIAEGQTDLLIMRTILFQYLQRTHSTHPPEDYQLRFKLLYALTNTGKDIKCFEELIGPFLLEWLPQLQAAPHIVEFVNLIINIVKFNAAYLDEDIVHGIVNNACHLCVYSADAGAVQGCLALLEAVVSYSLLPRAALPTFVAALCRTVIVEAYCQNSWKLMRCVVGADLGHAALQQMVELLRAAGGDDEGAGLARGAVFYINMALWGPRRVHTLHVSYLAVLPAFLKALAGRHQVVAYEVVLALESLVARVAHELHEVTWDLLLDIVRAVLQLDKSLEPPNELIHSRVHALITAIEQLHDAGQYRGDPEALLDLVDSCGHDRPEASAMRLVSARLAAPGAAGAALRVAERYVRLEPRRAVRLHALAALLAHARRHRAHDELAERAGAALAAAAADADAAVRAGAARALAELAKHCSSDVCVDLIDQLEKILNRPFEVYAADAADAAVPGDADTGDVRHAAAGLLDVLRERLPRAPAAPAARALLALLAHLERHYRRPALLRAHPAVRRPLLDVLLGLRADALLGVGLGAARSPWLLAEPPAPRGAAPAAPALPPGACLLPAGRAARALAAALAAEADWPVLAHVLRALAPLLHARALGVARRAPDLDLLAGALCGVAERGRGVPVSELHAAALPALAALASYHAFLEPQTQQRIVRCLLKYGMVLRSPQPYINALTIFTLETRDTMVKMLPEVLLDLSKISDTKAIASPMLEFLSTLTRLPRVFASFVEDQYMSVFAILLPYTNPSRYNHYVVSLAHHVIAAWFLKCRLSYRRNFVRFIIHGLHNYIIMPFEEQQAYKSNNYPAGQGAVNEDSSNRQRSSSLGSRAVSRAPLSGSRGAPAAFHVELTETCVDLLARYAFTPCSVKPQRSDTAEFLFNGGQSTTWLVGHKLLTITTSGCLQTSIKQGLCERCATLCRQHAESAASPGPAPAPPPSDASDAPAPTLQVNDAAEAPGNHLQVHGNSNHAPEVKRYSKYSLQHSRSTETSCSSLSISELQPPSSGHTTRQNSAENNKSTDPIIDALNQFTQRFEKMSKEVEHDGAAWARVGEPAAGGACPCWCARWAELHVRSPTGDVSWLLRMQNHMSESQLQEWPLQDVLALLSPPLGADLSGGAGDSRADPTSEGSPRMSRSASQRSHAPDLHKSSSDSVVGSDKKASQAARLGTQPINIPGSPQRQSSSSTTDDDDMLLIVPEGKSRHPVRRSNSSPEMSSSWKGAAREAAPDGELSADADDLILLPSCEPTSAPMALHASKKANKKSDMRVSCEAIPEEMCGTSPQPAPPHPHLMTYKSDPGTSGAESESETNAESNNPSAISAHHQLQKSPSPQTSSDSRVVLAPGAARDELPPLARSKRSNTISVMSPTRRRELRGAGAAPAGGVSPSFVFLQLYHNMSTFPISPSVPGEAPAPPSALSERPLKVSGEHHERTIKNLDLVPPVETYKVGVLYVGPGQQDDEVAILKNEYGSVRYMDFLRLLGTLVPLEGAEEPNLFLNLEKGGKDGRYTYVWNDDIMQVLFHVATAMPSSARDPHCNEKRKYIGNDFVSIVYNDSGHDFNILTIKGHFNLCIVVVEPLEHGMNRITLKSKDERLRSKFLAHVEPHCVSDPSAPLLARQHALHAALASQISLSLKPGSEAYASNSLERLRLIKRLRARAEAERQAAAARAPAPYAAAPERRRRVAIDDFNDYT